ncbi:hypothetical protein [Nocardia sp. NBC_01329]|uniref:hypothetical protein n=1 Tax=Nocardia sp. NBC_01329 TaxID=2903594 RepID=UPI002E134105|nr:hypothetical protein OG405_29090 [Nocardia sp. NBC_01329]
MTIARRAVGLCRADSDGGQLECLSRAHDLEVVYTVYTDTGSEFAARIAVQYVLEHGAEVVVIPYLGEQEVRAALAWRPVIWLADLVTATGVVARKS